MSKKRFKIDIQTLECKAEDKKIVADLYRHLDYLRTNTNSTDPAVRKILVKEIQSIKSMVNDDFAYKFYRVKVKIGPHEREVTFPYYPTTGDIQEILKTLQAKLREKRKHNKIVGSVSREFNGILYNMLGTPEKRTSFSGLVRNMTDPLDTLPELPKQDRLANLKGNGRVFNKPNSIIELSKTPEYAQRIKRAKKPYDKSKYVGVELELVCKKDAANLEAAFIKAGLSGSIYVKRDGSLRVDEGHYEEQASQFPHEVTLIAKESNINNIIERTCEVLNSKEIGAYVNDTCGMHVHLDMRHRDPALCYNNLYRSLPILGAMVPKNRLNNTYCVLNNTADFDTASRSNPNTNREPRYQAINAYAFNSHRTIEVRLHSGSTNIKKINNWVNILMAIVNTQSKVDANIVHPEDMVMFFGINQELLSFINKRIEKFKNSNVNNKQDNLEQIA